MTYITIPFSVELTDESSWEALDRNRTSFCTVRFHFRLEDKLLDEPHVYGDAIGVYQKPKGMTMKHVRSDTTEIEQVISTKSIENHLLQSEVITEIASELVSKGGIGSLLSLQSKAKSSVSEKLVSSFNMGVEISSSEKVTKIETLTIENTFPPEIDETIFSVPVYKRRAVDVTLAYIDYLNVDYVRSPLGLRKKAIKHPKVIHPHNHPNRISFGTPVATAYYWQLLPQSSKFIFERHHKTDVREPLQITIGQPRSSAQRVVKFPDVPTLYQIANAAFPKKWIWRKSAKQDWTEERLKEIEHDEVKGRPGWWQIFGDR